MTTLGDDRCAVAKLFLVLTLEVGEKLQRENTYFWR